MLRNIKNQFELKYDVKYEELVNILRKKDVEKE